jgi:hypothetical protein
MSPCLICQAKGREDRCMAQGKAEKRRKGFRPRPGRREACAVYRELILLDIRRGFANLGDNFASGIFFEFSGQVPGSLTGGTSGHSSVGRAQASQAWGRGFETRCPLQVILQAWPNSLFEVVASAGVTDFELRTLCWCCLMRFAV